MFLGIGMGMVGGGVQTSVQSLLFAQNEPGFMFTPQDITTLYQDRAGTTPVTAVGQSVGLRLSKDKGLALGSEVGSISSGWAAYGATPATVAYSSGVTITNNGTTGGGSFAFASVIGRWYRIAVTIGNGSGLSERLRVGNSVGGLELYNQLAGGATTIHVAATATTTYVNIAQTSANLGAVTTVSSFSVRELAGNHEVAINDAARGVYGREPKTGTRNRLTYTEQFDNAVWIKGTGGSISSNSAIAPDGTMTAHTYTWATSSPSFAYLSQQAVGVSQNPNVYSVWLKRPSGTGSRTVKLAVTDLMVSTATSGTFTVTEVWQRFEFTRTSASTTGFVGAGLFAGTSGSPIAAGELLEVWHPQLEPGSTATAYQRVVSQYDITEAGVASCYYVQTDGFDDAYVTPTITPGTDKVQVFAGVRKNSDAATGMLIESSASTSTNNGVFAIQAPDGTLPGYAWVSKGTIRVFADVVSGYPAPITKVLTGLGDISGDVSRFRINGVQVDETLTDQGSGNYLAYPAYIYARGGTSLPFNGRDYGHAVRFGPNLDAATIARVEALIARNTPTVTL